MKKVISTVSIFLFAVFAAIAQTDAEVTDAQLKKFADAYQSVQMANQEIQQKMVVAIEKEGLTPERFNELYEANMDPEKEVEATDKEKVKQEAAMAAIQGIQESSQAQMEEKIKEKGLTMEQFQGIGAMVQQDPELQQKLQAIMMEQQSNQ